MSNKYVEEFLHYKCVGDVLNSVSRGGKSEKEITESMAIIKRLKPIVIKEPMKYSVIDLCAGNALTSVLAVHLLPVKSAIAFDKKRRKGNYDIVERFAYAESDIKNSMDFITKDEIIISVHPCQAAELIVDMFNKSEAKALILMPCCNGFSNDIPCKPWLRTKLNEYDCWTFWLASKIKKAEVHVYTDSFVLSPKNNVIVARRG